MKCPGEGCISGTNEPKYGQSCFFVKPLSLKVILLKANLQFFIIWYSTLGASLSWQANYATNINKHNKCEAQFCYMIQLGKHLICRKKGNTMNYALTTDKLEFCVKTTKERIRQL